MQPESEMDRMASYSKVVCRKSGTVSGIEFPLSKVFARFKALTVISIARSSVETAEPDVGLLLTIEGDNELEGSILSVGDVECVGTAWLMAS